MNTTDKIWFSQEFLSLFPLYGRSQNGSDSLLQAYWATLESFSTQDTVEAFKRARQACKSFPTPAHFVEILKTIEAERKAKEPKLSTRPYGSCPKCKSDTQLRKLADDEWYEVCLKCYWQQRTTTFDEWKIKNGFEDKTMPEICQELKAREAL